jgi:nucleotide-binding universal stress UspA family protein
MNETSIEPAPNRQFEIGTDGPHAIVVGLDGSMPSLRAAAYAAGLARRQHTRLVAVYVRTQPAALICFGDPRSGDPLTVLSEVAREVRAGAVIVGLSAGLAHRVAGSLAIRLVRCGRWPVIVVP